MADSLAYKRVKNHQKSGIAGSPPIYHHSGIWLTTYQLRLLADALDNISAQGVSFMVGSQTKTKSNVVKTVEILPLQSTTNINDENPGLALFEFNGFIGHFLATLERVPGSLNQMLIDNNPGGGGGVNQKTPPPFPPVG